MTTVPAAAIVCGIRPRCRPVAPPRPASVHAVHQLCGTDRAAAQGPRTSNPGSFGQLDHNLTPFGPLERILRPLIRDATAKLGKFNLGSSALARRLAQAGISKSPVNFRAEQLLWAVGGFVAAVGADRSGRPGREVQPGPGCRGRGRKRGRRIPLPGLLAGSADQKAGGADDGGVPQPRGDDGAGRGRRRKRHRCTGPGVQERPRRALQGIRQGPR